MKFKTMIALALASMMLVACGKVPAGNVGVKVYLLGGAKGVDSEVLTPGRYWIGWNEELHLFPTFTQNYVWTADERPGSETNEELTFQTREGLTVKADVGISYAIQPEKVSTVFQKYRRGVDEITDIYLRNMIQDALVIFSSSLPIESVYGEGKADLMNKVEQEVRRQVEPIGVKVERIYWIGTVRMDDIVKDSISNKIRATQMSQQRQNEVAQSKAEADKVIEEARGTAQSILINAQAQAEANGIIAESLTPELVNYKAIEKWDGMLPRFTGSGPLPFIDVGAPEPKTQERVAPAAGAK